MKLEDLVIKAVGKAWQASGHFYKGKRQDAINRLYELVQVVSEGLEQLDDEKCESSESSKS